MKIDKLKSLKPFHKRDLIVYALVFGIIVLLFFLFLCIFNDDNSTENIGFTVQKDNDVVLTYYHKTEKFEISQSFSSLVKISKAESGYLVTIYTSESKDGYNELFVDLSDKNVKMQDSTCPSKECTYLKEVSSSGMIYCAPHSIKITPIGGSGFIPIVAG